MATIGTLRYDEAKDRYKGDLKTLTIRASVELVAARKTGDSQPDYRILSEGVEIGAAWKRVSKRSGNEYLSLSIQAPELGRRTLYANLGKMPGQDNPDVFSIIWNTDNDRG